MLKQQPGQGNPQHAPAIGASDANAQLEALDCAWCLKEQGITPRDGSHGICVPHAEQMIAEARERRAQQKEARQ